MPPRSNQKSTTDWLAAGIPRPTVDSQASWDLRKRRLHPKQIQFISCGHLEALYGGAAGGGKTEALLADNLQYTRYPRYHSLTLRRTFKELSLPGSIMHRALEWLGRDHWNDNEKRFVFPNGALMQFGYCDSEGDLSRYKSAQFHRVYIDEVTGWPEGWYAFLFSRIRRVVGDKIPLAMRSATNPDGVGAEWVRRRFGIPDGEVISTPIEDATEDRIFIPARVEDNPTIDLVSYEKALSRLGPTRYQQLRFGRWLRNFEGLVYSGFNDARNCVYDTPGLVRYILGIDYGFRDETALVVLGWAEHSRTVYVIACEKLSGATPSDAARLALAYERRYNPDRIVGDTGGMGKGYAEEARQRFGIPVEAAQKTNKRGYLDLFNGALKDGDVKILRPACDALRKEWLELPWDGDERFREADGFDNHLADACLYAWRAATAFAEVDKSSPKLSPYEQDYDSINSEREKRREEVRRQHEGGGALDRWKHGERSGTRRWGR